jgi:hypothetical protein
LCRVRGDLLQAGIFHCRALNAAREIGSHWSEAHALAGLARCALASDTIADAEIGLQQAQEIFQRIGAAADTASISAELAALSAPS